MVAPGKLSDFKLKRGYRMPSAELDRLGFLSRPLYRRGLSQGKLHQFVFGGEYGQQGAAFD